jgi:hypothetical protein
MRKMLLVLLVPLVLAGVLLVECGVFRPEDPQTAGYRAYRKAHGELLSEHSARVVSWNRAALAGNWYGSQRHKRRLREMDEEYRSAHRQLREEFGLPPEKEADEDTRWEKVR